MSTKEALTANMKTAMRAKDSHTRDVIRLMLAAIKQVEIDSDSGDALDEAGVMAVLTKQAKQRRDSIAVYTESGRTELAEVEQNELAVIEEYLPKMMSREEVAQAASETIAAMGVTDLSGMGKVMGRLMGQLKGKADGGLISAVVKEQLQG